MTLSEQTRSAIMDRRRPPSFVDLRAFAAEIAEELQALARCNGSDAYLANRIALLSSGTESPVGALHLPEGGGCVEAMPRDEFIILLTGRLWLAAGRQEHFLGPNDAVVVPQGARFAWRAEAGTTAITLSYPESRAGGRTITPIRKDPPLAPSGKPAEDVLLGPAPDCRNFNDYRVDDGKFVCGTWDSTPYRRKGFLYSHYEIMLISEGSVTFSDEHDRVGTFKAGDLILAEAGSYCAWDSPDHVTKVFAIYRI
ncbi:MAG: cupin domain-containing protein [Sphingobium sp.]